MALFIFQDFTIPPRYFDYLVLLHCKEPLIRMTSFATRKSSARCLHYFIQGLARWCFHKLLFAVRMSPGRCIQVPYEAVLHIVLSQTAKIIHQMVLYVPRNVPRSTLLALHCLSPTKICVPYVRKAIHSVDVPRGGLVFSMLCEVDTLISCIWQGGSLSPCNSRSPSKA